MKHVLLTILLTAAFSANANTTEPWVLPIKNVVDGDTINTVVECLPAPLNRMKIRVLGIDTPEKGTLAKCNDERLKSKQATAFLKSLAADAATMTVTNCKHDKYGGRLDCAVSINGKDVATEMINAGYAREYWGGAKKSWCK